MDEGGEHYAQAIEQVVEQLSFACTHVSDNDFRIHSKTTAETVASLQNEQENRIAAAFGPKKASPEYLSGQLMSIYQADAAAVAASAKGGYSSTFNTMSDEAVKFFKKEMKQRIHEWEGSFQFAYGRDPSPQDKATLRPIYELYKVVKTRAQGGPVPVPQQQQQQPVSSSGHHHPHQPAHSNTHATHHHHHQPVAAPSPAASTTNLTSSTGGGGGSSTGNLSATSGGSSRTPAAPAASNPTGPSFPSAAAAGSAEGPDIDQLVAEKRALKRQLHQFEGDFEERHGRKPGKEDRKARAKEYQRYGELKMLLNEHAKNNEA